MRSKPHIASFFDQEDRVSEREFQVPVEQPLALSINEQPAAVIMRQPGDDIELAVGYCLTEGLVGDVSEILSARHCESGPDAVNVFIEGTPPSHVRRVGTGCTDAQESPESLPDALTPGGEVVWDAADLLSMLPQFRDHQEQRRQSGGTHGAALFDRSGKLVVLHEDIGRHNAVDKVVGHCLLRKVALSEMALVVTGRASSTMVTKTVRAGIPLLATMSNATSLGLELAEKLGLTLVTYLRGKRFRICSHLYRIATPSAEARPEEA